MVHHAAPEEVMAAIAAFRFVQGGKGPSQSTAFANTLPQRHWLHIGESLAAA
jgi:hypothetical protein